MNTVENLSTAREMVRVFTFSPMESPMKENSRMVNTMVKGLSNILTVTLTKETGSMTRNMAREF